MKKITVEQLSELAIEASLEDDVDYEPFNKKLIFNIASTHVIDHFVKEDKELTEELIVAYATITKLLAENTLLHYRQQVDDS